MVEPYRKAEVLFANSEFTKGELIDVLGCDPQRIHVTNLGVKPFFHDVPRSKPERVRNFLFFGRLVPEKGIGDALEAFGRLAKQGHEFQFHVLGSGNAAHVQGLAQRAGLGDRVQLIPHQGDAGLSRELEWADVAVLPSYSESFGLAIAEAQAAGLPVVAYAAGSVPEVVADGETAWLAPLRDVDGLEKALAATLKNPEEVYRRGLAGRERVARLFRWELTAEKVLDGLRQVESRRQAA